MRADIGPVDEKVKNQVDFLGIPHPNAIHGMVAANRAFRNSAFEIFCIFGYVNCH
jgi:hypothetical protein